MCYGHTYKHAGLLLISLLLASCGPGGNYSGDVVPSAVNPPANVTGPNSFLLFPNPILQSDGSLQTDTTAYATAYYAALDPTNARDTLAKWKAANGFGTTPGALGEQTIVIGDTRDLGYGRRMTVRQNTDGTIAAMVNNYVVTPAETTYGSYTHLNVEAAVAQDNRWFIGTTAIEYRPAPGVSPGTNCLGCFVQFSFFDPSGNRALMVDLDGRGPKAMPGPCSSCHGGRLGPLTPATGSPTGMPLFNLIQNSVSLARGDVQGRLHDLKVGTFDFSTAPGYTRADQEATMKTINKIVLCSYPLGVGHTAYAEDLCRPTAGWDEWWGGNDTFIKQPYGGDGMPNATYADTYVPPGWSGTTAQVALYQNVVQDNCRTCHILRGTIDQSEIAFTDDPDWGTLGYDNFLGYADRIYDHVFNIGNMPLSKFVSDRFWSGTAPELLADWLATQGYVTRDSSGAILKPGRPVADPGPDRTTDSPATLSAANSDYATTYAWSIVSGAGGALTNANSATAALTGVSGTTYGVQLIVGNGTTQSTPALLNVTIATPGSPELPIAAANIRFSDIKAILQDTVPGENPSSYLQDCTSCHTTSSLTTAALTPLVYNNIDRNGDGLTDSGTLGSIDDLWFYNELYGRLNLTDIDASPLLRKPTGHHHGGGTVLNLTASGSCLSTDCGTLYSNAGLTYGDYYRAQYNKIVLWALNGAPQ